MSAAVDERPDVEVVNLPDLDAELPCNAPRGCTRAAVWVARCSGPDRHPWLLCDDHRAECEEAQRRVSAALGARAALFASLGIPVQRVTVCNKCEAIWPDPIVWGRL